MNEVVKWWRANNPGDAQRSDDEITLDAASKYPDTFQQYPDAMADFNRIHKELLQSEVTPIDYVKQAAGSVIRGVADVPAGLLESVAIGGKALEDHAPDWTLLGEERGKPVEDRAAWTLAQKIRGVADKLAPDPVEGLQDSFLATAVPQGIGSAAGFMLGGGVGKLMLRGGLNAVLETTAKEAADAALKEGLTKGMTEAAAKDYAKKVAARAVDLGKSNLAAKTVEAVPIAGLGATTQGASAWKEAKAAGAGDDAANMVFLLNLGVGTSEIVPLSKMLKRLDGISGGTFTKTLIEAGKESFEEGLQEAAQQFAGNYIAKGYFDKDRDLLAGLGVNAGAGAVTGALFSLITHGIGAKLGAHEKTSPDATVAPPVTPRTQTTTRGDVASVASGDIDVRQNFVTDEDKKRVSDLLEMERSKAYGPVMDQLSAEVGARIASAPALFDYYTAQKNALPLDSKDAKAVRFTPTTAEQLSEQLILRGEKKGGGEDVQENEEEKVLTPEAAAVDQTTSTAAPAETPPASTTVATPPPPPAVTPPVVTPPVTPPAVDPLLAARQAAANAPATNPTPTAKPIRELFEAKDPETGQPLGGPSRFLVTKNPSVGVQRMATSDPLAVELGATKEGEMEHPFRVTVFQGNDPLGHESFETLAAARKYAQLRVNGIFGHGQLVRTAESLVAKEAKALDRMTPKQRVEHLKGLESIWRSSASDAEREAFATLVKKYRGTTLAENVKPKAAAPKSKELSEKPAQKTTGQGELIVAEINASIEAGRAQLVQHEKRESEVEQDVKYVRTKGDPVVGKAAEIKEGYPAKQVRGLIVGVHNNGTVTLRSFDGGEDKVITWGKSARLLSIKSTGNTKGGAVLEGSGQKASAFWKENPTPDELYTDAERTQTESPKQAVLLSPDGKTVVRGTAYTNVSNQRGKASERVRYVSIGTARDGVQGVRLQSLLDAKYKLIGALKVAPTKGFSATLSPTEWEAAKVEIVKLVNAAKGGATAVESGFQAPSGASVDALDHASAPVESASSAAAASPVEVELDAEEIKTLREALGDVSHIKTDSDLTDALMGSPEAVELIREITIAHVKLAGDITAAPAIMRGIEKIIYETIVKPSQSEGGPKRPGEAGQHGAAAQGAQSGRANTQSGTSGATGEAVRSPAQTGGNTGTQAQGAQTTETAEEAGAWGKTADGTLVRHAKGGFISIDDVDAELPDESVSISEPGWLTTTGEFVPAEATAAVRMQGVDIGGHERAALSWIENNQPAWYEELYTLAVKKGIITDDMPLEAALQDDAAIGLVKGFMLSKGFVRVAADHTRIAFEGKPNKTQRALLMDSAVNNQATLLHEISDTRTKELYAPPKEKKAFVYNVGDSENGMLALRHSAAKKAVRDTRAAGARFNALLDTLASLGVPVKLLREQVGKQIREFGRYDQYPRRITLSLADAVKPTVSNFADLLEEAMHAVFANETPARRAQMEQAVATVSDELLGIGDYMSSEYTEAQAAKVLQEERLVATVGKHLVKSGFNPEESRGFAQAVVRLLKDWAHQLVMWLAEARGQTISPARAQAYFENRVKAILSGDAQFSVIDYLGGPKLTEFERLTLFEQAERTVRYVNGERHSNSAFVDNPHEPVSKDVDSSELKKPQVAAQNYIHDTLKDAFKVFDVTEGLNTAGIAFEDFARKIGLPTEIGRVEHYPAGVLPTDIIDQTNKDLAAIGQPTINPHLKFSDVNPTVIKRAAAQAHRVLQVLAGSLSEKRRISERDAVGKFEQLQRDNLETRELLSSYEDLDLVLSLSKKTLLGQLEEMRKDAVTIGKEGRKAGVLEQVLEGLDEKLDTTSGHTQWMKALNAISKRLDGVKFADLLEGVAKLDIDWDTASVADVKGKIFVAGDASVTPLMQATKESKALLAGVIAFGKANKNVMDLLGLRRSEAFEERKAMNEALKQALADHADAVKEAKDLVMKNRKLAKVEYTYEQNPVTGEMESTGRVSNVTLTRVGKRAIRVLNRLELLKKRRRELLDERERDGLFNQWHRAFAPVLQGRLTALEKMLGIQFQDWQVQAGAKYPVPPTATSSLEAVMANEKTLAFTAEGLAALRADMMKLGEWLDKVPEPKRGGDWADLKAIFDKATHADITRGHESIQQNWIMRTLAPMTDRLRFIGTPVARLLGSRVYNMQAWMREFMSSVERYSHPWETAESNVMKATGLNQEAVRSRIYQPMLGWLEKNQHLLASATDAAGAEAAAVRGALRYLETDSATSTLLARGGARARVEAYIRHTVRNATLVADHGKRLGNKILDEAGGYKVFRDVLGQAPFTVLRSFSEFGGRVFNLMVDSPWANEKLKAADVAAEYHADPAALSARLQSYTPPEIWQTFGKAWANRDGRSSFMSPKGEDGLQHFADRAHVMQAFEAAGGDLVKFAETLYALEGGATELADFVGETLGQWQTNFNLIEAINQEATTLDTSNMPKPGPRRYLADARKSEELPKEFLEYMPYDSRTLLQVTKGQVYQAAFGRNLEAWRSNLKTARDEQVDLSEAWHAIYDYYTALGLKGKKLREAMQAEVTGGFKNVPGVKTAAKRASWTQLEQAPRNIQSLNVVGEQFEAMLTLNRDRPPEFRAWNNLVGALAGATVSGPATAFTDNIATVEQPFRRMGFDWQAIKWVMGEKKNEMTIAANSLLQVVGMSLGRIGNRVKLMNDLGMMDDDATISAKDKALAYMDELNYSTNPLEKGVRAVSQTIRYALGTGAGRAKEGAAVYPTFKPHSPFVWAASITHMATALQWITTYENLVGAAVRHFESNPLDASNPDFKFTQKAIADLGFKSGWRAWEFLTGRLADYGIGGLEQVARDAVARRAADPSAGLLERDAMVKLAQLAQNEITLDSGITTRHPFLMTSSVGNALNPILGWSLQKAFDFVMGFRGPDGKRTAQATRTAVVAMVLGILPSALAYALLRDLYDEYVMKRKGNVKDLASIDGPRDLFATVIENATRVGTMGIAGDMFNQFVNYDTARPVSLDSRIFMTSSLMAFGKSLQSWAYQGHADWATVGRPMLASLGGAGYLQYADSINGIFGLDNAESRIARRTAVNNYLRAAGRELNLDVRKGGVGNQSMPTPVKPFIGQMMMAAYANDAMAFQEAYRNAKLAAKEMGSENPEDTVKRSFAGMNPMRVVFKTDPSQSEVGRMLHTMSDQGRSSVAEAMSRYNHYGAQIGVKPKENKPAAKPGLALPGVPTLTELRKQAAGFGVSL